VKHDFSPYRNKVFIETGTYVADGVKAAFAADCFRRIISIEASSHYFDISVERCKDLPNVELYYGESAEILPNILKDITVNCTFWLDAHYCGDYTSGTFATVPLMKELDIIAQHPVKTHTILIDDMRLLRKATREWQVDYGVNDVILKLLSINKDYRVSFDKGVTKDDILIAQP